MDVVTLSFEDLNAILRWYNLAFNLEKKSSSMNYIPDENTLIKIRVLLLTKEEQENSSKKFRDRFGKFF